MGRIKATILKKQDRPVTESKPPSMRRFKRRGKEPVKSYIPSMRGLRRPARRVDKLDGQFIQRMPDVLIFRFKKKHRPRETVVHEHYSDERKNRTSTRRVDFFTCATNDSARLAQMELMVEQGLGKIETKPSKVILHRVDKQDKYFKFHNHDLKY